MGNRRVSSRASKVIGPDGEPHKRSDFPDAPHWSEKWQCPPFVIYGHTPRPEPLRLKWSLGIDTACVQGGALTACILPGKELVQVPAHAAYYKNGGGR